MPQTPDTAPRTRRQMREWEKQSLKAARKFSCTTSRTLLLGMLATMTIVVPLSGILSPNLSIAAPNEDFTQHETLVNTVLSAALANSEGNVSGLEAVPAAARARLRQAAELGVCSPDQTGADGVTAAVETGPVVMWPMARGSYTYTSPWGMRIHPVTGARAMHEGIDLAAPLGTPIMAVYDGVVEKAGPYGSQMAIYIKHEIDGQVFYSGYLHMYTSGIYVKEGERVKAGQVIAGVGNSGRSTGPHLHFEIRDEDKISEDPLTWLKAHKAVFAGAECQ